MKFLFLFFILFSLSCARLPVREKSQAMRKASKAPILVDDLSFTDLKEALLANIKFIESSPRLGSEIQFGPKKVSKNAYIQALKTLLDQSQNFEQFNQNVKKNFDFYEVYGNENWGEIKVTGYYSPLIKGVKKPNKEFPQPILSTPEDMLTLDIDAFAEDFPKWKIFKDDVLEQSKTRSVARARLEKNQNGTNRIVPFFKRNEIDPHRWSEYKKYALAYTDPVEAFFLQIQGSGVVEFPNGERITVGYESQNGHPYVAIGSKLLDKIPKEKMSMQSIRNYLKTLSPQEQQVILNFNPSYVFFKKLGSRPIAYLGTEVADGRTVATDQSLFPKGALAFLEFEKPKFNSLNDHEPSRWEKSSRFVIDQDTGGAIRGPGRLDLYIGEGELAAQTAGVMKNPGRLYYLVPKN